MGAAYRRGLQEFKDHDFDSAAGDKAVAGIDRPPTELLGKAKERLLGLAQTTATEAREEAHRTTWMTVLLLSLATAAGAPARLVARRPNISLPPTTVPPPLTPLAPPPTPRPTDRLERGGESGRGAG